MKRNGKCVEDVRGGSFVDLFGIITHAISRDTSIRYYEIIEGEMAGCKRFLWRDLCFTQAMAIMPIRIVFI